MLRKKLLEQRINLGKSLKKERVSMNVTQRDFADFAQLDRSTVSKLENGWGAAMLDTMLIYQDALERYPFTKKTV